MEEYEFNLIDRIDAIRKANEKYNLLDNSYLAFSGGKDSTILHYLIDDALPNNKIPRVYIDTGIEFLDIKEFVLEMQRNDDRFVIVKPTKPIKATLEEYGYPFKSKQHSHALSIYQHSGMSKAVIVYLKEKTGRIRCPNCLRHQFSSYYKLKVSDLCCKKMKKEPSAKWAKQNNKSISITGLRKDEGGSRRTLKGCIITDKEGNLKKFHPLFPVDEDFEEEYIERKKIKLCKLYYPPFNFKRTGCKGCPFALDLQEQLSLMEVYLPKERNQCELIWKPVYEEYRRLGYRLNKQEQMKLF